jgi:hypothetical protein
VLHTNTFALNKTYVSYVNSAHKTLSNCIKAYYISDSLNINKLILWLYLLQHQEHISYLNSTTLNVHLSHCTSCTTIARYPVVRALPRNFVKYECSPRFFGESVGINLYNIMQNFLSWSYRLGRALTFTVTCSIFYVCNFYEHEIGYYMKQLNVNSKVKASSWMYILQPWCYAENGKILKAHLQ